MSTKQHKVFMVHGDDERISTIIDNAVKFSDEVVSVRYGIGKTAGSINILVTFKDKSVESTDFPFINLNGQSDNYVRPCWLVCELVPAMVRASPKFYHIKHHNCFSDTIARVDYPRATPYFKYLHNPRKLSNGWHKCALEDLYIDNRLGDSGFEEIDLKLFSEFDTN